MGSCSLERFKNLIRDLYKGNKLFDLEKDLKYKFKNRALLVKALMHPSYKGNHPEISFDYERLEFLGDSVIAFLVTTYLFEKYTGNEEGFLSKRKGKIGSKAFLWELGKTLHLERYIFSPSIELLAKSRSTFENAFEALMAAIYLDGGLRSAKKVFFRIGRGRLDKVEQNENLHDPKSLLQEYNLKANQDLPFYDTKENPDDPGFISSVYIGGKLLCCGSGASKKEAERSAAMYGCKQLKLL